MKLFNHFTIKINNVIFSLIYKSKVFIFIFSIIKIIIVNLILKRILLLLKKIKKSILFKKSFIKIILSDVTDLIIILI